MKANKDEMLKFKRLFHGKRPATFQVFPEHARSTVKARAGTIKLTPGKLDALGRINEKGAAVCMMINKGNGEGRKSENVVEVTAVFLDADGNLELRAIKEASIPPHLIVESSPSRYHAYWRVSGLRRELFEDGQKQLAQIFGSDPHVCDLPRAMRMPGTINWGHGAPFRARVVHRSANSEPIPWEQFAKRVLKGAPGLQEPLRKAGESGGAKLTEIDVPAIKQALALIPPDDRAVWLHVGMAIHSVLPNSDGRQLWDDWSGRSSKFVASDQETTWKHFKPGGIRLPTLFWLAKRCSKESGTVDWPSNEIELGQIFASNHSDRLRYVQSEDAWYFWDGARWSRDRNAAQQFAQAFLLGERDAAIRTGTKGAGALSVANAKNILQAAKVEGVLQARRADFDAKPDVMAVKNGVIHLPTRTFRQARPSDRISYCAAVEFDAEAKCATWRKFLHEVTGDDVEMCKFLRRAIGYTLYGHTSEQKMFVLIGPGANGKGVFLHTLAKIIGDYACAVQASLLRPNFGNANGPTPALAAIKGRRLLVCSEMPKNKPFDEAFVKQLTGNDAVSGRGLYAEQEEFVPVGKLWLSVNNMPKVRFDDMAMWRRVVPIPFERRFIGENADPRLEDKLKKEGPGILNWALRGAELYAKEGRLHLPEKCINFRKTLRGEEDTVGAWVDSECKRAENAQVQSTVAYGSYSAFVKAEKRDPLNREEFKATMKSKGFRHRKLNTFNVYEGLKLRSSSTATV